MVESRREANKRKCRQKILKASRRLFKEYGYENTMIEDVANKAEISKATLYNYFPNKESLLVGTMDDVAYAFGKYIDGLDESLDAEGKIRKSLTFLIMDSIPFLSVSRRILFLNACENSPMYGKINIVEDVFAQLAEQGKEENVFTKDITTKEIVDQLVGIYLISQFQWTDLEEINEEECTRRISSLMDRMLVSFYNK